MGKIGDSRAEEFLLEVLEKDLNVSVRIWAGYALGKMNNQKGVEYLISSLKNVDEEDIKNIIKFLGKVGSKKAINPLIKLLKNQKGKYRVYASMALEEIGDSKAIEPLISAGRSLELVKFGDKAVEPLISLLGHKKLNKRIFAAETLALIGSTNAIGPIKGALWSSTGAKERDFRIALIKALENIGTEEAIKIVKKYEKKHPYYF